MLDIAIKLLEWFKPSDWSSSDFHTGIVYGLVISGVASWLFFRDRLRIQADCDKAERRADAAKSEYTPEERRVRVNMAYKAASRAARNIHMSTESFKDHAHGIISFSRGSVSEPAFSSIQKSVEKAVSHFNDGEIGAARQCLNDVMDNLRNH
jgi:uncharacterized protein (UPF0332 family)